MAQKKYMFSLNISMYVYVFDVLSKLNKLCTCNPDEMKYNPAWTIINSIIKCERLRARNLFYLIGVVHKAPIKGISIESYLYSSYV